MAYFGELKGMDRTKARDFSLAYLERVVLAAKAFRLGTLEYSDRIKLSALLRK